MSEALQHQLKRISEKLNALLKQQSVLQKENESLKSELRLLKLEKEKCRQQAEELNQRLAVFNMSGSGLEGEEKKEMERRINHYIREIDRCISMLQS